MNVILGLPAMASEHNTTPEAVAQALDESRLAFGINLSRWRRLNGWTQETAESWARAAGFAVFFNSQWSRMERGDIDRPGPSLFRALGILNHKVAAQDWGKGLTAAMRERLEGSKPVAEGDHIWTASDFYSCFIGEKEWPPMADPVPQITPAEAEAWSTQLQQWFSEIMRSNGLGLLQALAGLMEHVPAEEHGTIQNVVGGIDTYSAAQLNRLRTKEGELLPCSWMDEWNEEQNRPIQLVKGDHWRFVLRDS